MSSDTQVALVTGASGALGGAMAMNLARRGVTPILLGRKTAALEALYDRIVDDTGCQPAILNLDLEKAHWAQYRELAATIDGEFGRLDLLVHCAARFNGLQPMLEVDLNEWAKTLHVDLNAPYLMTRALAGLLAAAPAGQIVFIGDPVAASPKAYWGAYGVAKAGLATLAGILGEELEHTGVKVHCPVPGPIRSALRKKAFPAEPAERTRPPEQVAEEILAGILD